MEDRSVCKVCGESHEAVLASEWKKDGVIYSRVYQCPITGTGVLEWMGDMIFKGVPIPKGAIVITSVVEA